MSSFRNSSQTGLNKVMLKRSIAAIALSCVAALAVTGCNDEKRNEHKMTVVHGKTMGTFYTVNVTGGFKGGEEALKKLSDDTFNRICDIISTFDKNAELAKVNEYHDTKPYEISKELGKIIQETVYQGRRIDGATDISVGPLVNLWGFGKDKKKNQAPTSEEIQETLKLVGLDKFEIRTDSEKSYLVKHNENVRLDLATVGEGLGADALCRKLIELGYTDFMVSVAGASRSYGVNSKGLKWRLGVEDPTSPERKVLFPICALDKAVTTAGSYRNFFKDDKTGTVYSHAIDPKTGYPVSHHTLSVTVISDSAFESDALDTGLLVLGADKALEFGEKNNIPIATVEYENGKTVIRHTNNFKKYIDCAKNIK